jgi:hypothetical protein
VPRLGRYIRIVGVSLVAFEIFALAGCAGTDFVTSNDLRTLDDVTNCAELESFTSALDTLYEAHVVGMDYVRSAQDRAAEVGASLGC